MDLEQQFEGVLQFIDNNLSENLHFERLAVEAGVPFNHFEFIFYSLYHTQVADYIALLRNIEAAQTLGFDKSVSILDVAKAAGYSSAVEFTQAFTSSIGQTPEAFRQAPDWGNFFIKQQPLKTLSQGHNTLTDVDVNIEAIRLDRLDLVLIKHRGPKEYLSQTMQALSAFKKAHQLPLSDCRRFNFIYNLPQNMNTDHAIDIGVSITPTKASELQVVMADSKYFNVTALQSGIYATFSHKGSEIALQDKINYLYHTWLTKNDFTLTEHPLVFEHVERIEDANDVHVKVYLAVTPHLECM
ncbi:AraC family transcriptional regulator [Shewanella sp. OMA3-2]|uniref:AraC family transcriptional regulator n=1 Tax=Shewanella sp. OMA3-2 TaxID=2908650 RepID=UPI001F3ACA7E|nr:AraC family transcriptional regulator [Shewanella sp. OMA3-2]UJF23285.1 AraC family transcriptional regulator [Shewanella sp. OMA3-2]